MKCPDCGKQLVCKRNGVPIYTNSATNPTKKEMEATHLCNGDLWECECGCIFVDGVNKTLKPVAVVSMK